MGERSFAEDVKQLGYGLKVIIARNECMLERQRREKPSETVTNRTAINTATSLNIGVLRVTGW